MFLLLIILILTIIYTFIRYVTYNYNYWKNIGVPYEEPSFLFGSMKDVILLKRHIGETMTDVYRKHKNLPYVGFYKFRNPELLIRDIELIKNIIIKDFSHFQANDIDINDKEYYTNKNPFVLVGDEWKTSRSQMLQCFTSAKLKMLVPSMVSVSDRFVKYIEDTTKKQGALESKDISVRFTVENVINTAFGLEANCFEEGTSKFMDMSNKIFHPSLATSIRLMAVVLFPKLSNLLDIRFVPKDVGEYFVAMINKLITYRKENNIERKDFLDILIETEKKFKNEGYAINDIMSHAMSLFIDGTETSANSMAFFLYNIAKHLDVQKKLHDEVVTVMTKYDGKLTYEGIQEMSYLDCVFNESMRMYPPGLVLVKRCTKDYDLVSPDNNPKKTIQLKAGMSVTLPVYAIHYDEQYFPDPERFDPERFSDENKQQIIKGTYMPFGEGQRICLGQRFATLQIKVATALLVSKYELRVNEKTIQPIQIDPRYLMILAKGGLWLDFHKRENV